MMISPSGQSLAIYRLPKSLRFPVDVPMFERRATHMSSIKDCRATTGKFRISKRPVNKRGIIDRSTKKGHQIPQFSRPQEVRMTSSINFLRFSLTRSVATDTYHRSMQSNVLS